MMLICKEIKKILFDAGRGRAVRGRHSLERKDIHHETWYINDERNDAPRCRPHSLEVRAERAFHIEGTNEIIGDAYPLCVLPGDTKRIARTGTCLSPRRKFVGEDAAYIPHIDSPQGSKFIQRVCGLRLKKKPTDSGEIHLIVLDTMRQDDFKERAQHVE